MWIRRIFEPPIIALRRLSAAGDLAICDELQLHPNACKSLAKVESIKRAIHFIDHQSKDAADMFCVSISFCTG
uniref:Mg_chelatase domain-containing protein n=1 Tax=Bursaphelenchus xylophilus TaxID=6326 RepID=A0A1I7S8H1_BURXY